MPLEQKLLHTFPKSLKITWARATEDLNNVFVFKCIWVPHTIPWAE